MPILEIDVPLTTATARFPDGTSESVTAPPGTYRHAVVASPTDPAAAIGALTVRADVHDGVAARLEALARAPRFVVERRPRVAGGGSVRVLALVGSGIPREHGDAPACAGGRPGTAGTLGTAQPDAVLLPARDPAESEGQRAAWTAAAGRELVARALLRAAQERTRARGLRERAGRLRGGTEPLGRWEVLQWLTDGRFAGRGAQDAAARHALDGRSTALVDVAEGLPVHDDAPPEGSHGWGVVVRAGRADPVEVSP
ncbi:hypothetical protein [Cellulomonas sp. PhB143]|uniref:hypothetical protein n=1 Tax=Cellulomonas sp. PhB143 TaxID=2485186 RepID=UPI000F4A55A5|nr:hypothetical protein [Cellulomonas sp. PhB143]ROS76514.1 hypothetical protein EDF32_1329 [Cellulomonas sp. PhB143]